MMIIPRYLKRGDIIGVTAPSVGTIDDSDKERFCNAISKVRMLGYDVLMTSDVFPSEGRFISYEERAEEFRSLLEDDSIACIISARGGDHQEELLDLMDWDAVKAHPKWIQGYSDNTVLLFMITVEYDIATIYCGNFGDLGMEPWHRSIRENMEFLEGSRSSQLSFSDEEVWAIQGMTRFGGIAEIRDKVCMHSLEEASFRGRLIGGCMDILERYHDNGAVDLSHFIRRYFDDGIIWYMETFDSEDERIERMLIGMSEDGWFEGVTGFIFGRPLFYDGAGYEDIVSRALRGYDVPKIFNADVGHIAPRMVFINGMLADVHFKDTAYTITYLSKNG